MKFYDRVSSAFWRFAFKHTVLATVVMTALFATVAMVVGLAVEAAIRPPPLQALLTSAPTEVQAAPERNLDVEVRRLRREFDELQAERVKLMERVIALQAEAIEKGHAEPGVFPSGLADEPGD